MVKKVGVLSLAYCGGCEVALLSVGDMLEKIINGDISLEYCTIAVDNVEIPKVDVMLVTGAVRSQRDEELVKIAREKAKVLVPFGSCACYGGIPGLLNLENIENVLEEVFKKKTLASGGRAPTRLLHEAKPVGAVVDVDYIVPGCPPPQGLISTLATAILQNKPVRLPDTNVCTDCPRKRSEKIISVKPRQRIRSLSDLDPDKCLLEQGVLCLGSITVGGCNALCLKKGAWCSGCMGPLPGKSFDEEFIDLVSSVFSNASVEELRRAIPDLLKIAYMFVSPRSKEGERK